MLAVVAAGALVGFAALRRRSLPSADDDDEPPLATRPVRLPPTAPTITPNYGAPSPSGSIAPIPMMPNRTKDPFLDLERPSFYDITNRIDPLVQKPVAPAPFFGPEVGAISNVHVRDTTSIRGRETQTFQPGKEMRNVAPVHADLIGPGLGTSASKAAGGQGFHYGSVRMMPNDIYTHQREQRGSIVPGKSHIDARTSQAALRKQQPDRFFEVSPSYTTAAPGRAAITAPTTRTEPTPESTNRAQMAPHLGGPATSALTIGASDRGAYTTFADHSQRGQPVADFGAPSHATQAGYQLTQGSIDPRENQRTLTTDSGARLLPIDNPGQPLFQPSTSQARATLRGGDAQIPASNIAPQAPSMATLAASDTMRTTERQLTQNNAYVGGAAWAGPATSSQQQAKDAFAAGKAGHPTLKEMTHQAYVGSANSSQKAAMSYADILSAEGYSNREVQETDRTNPMQGSSTMLGAANFNAEMKEEPVNAARTNGVDGAQHTNLYVRNNILESNPNKQYAEPARLDTAVLVSNDISLDDTIKRPLPPSTELTKRTDSSRSVL